MAEERVPAERDYDLSLCFSIDSFTSHHRFLSKVGFFLCYGKAALLKGAYMQTRWRRGIETRNLPVPEVEYNCING